MGIYVIYDRKLKNVIDLVDWDMLEYYLKVNFEDTWNLYGVAYVENRDEFRALGLNCYSDYLLDDILTDIEKYRNEYLNFGISD